MEGPTDSAEHSADPTSSMAASQGRKVILGKDGKPCRSCNSKLAFSAAMKASGTSGTSAAAKEARLTSPIGQSESSKAMSECPPDGEALGQNTWTFLHSAAAYYPDKPSEAQRSAMLTMIQALPHIYPCHTCAESLQEELEREKRTKKSWEEGAPLGDAVRTGLGFRKWLCGLHNEVNTRLGKPIWQCTEETLQRRWKDGPPDGRCD